MKQVDSEFIEFAAVSPAPLSHYEITKTLEVEKFELSLEDVAAETIDLEASQKPRSNFMLVMTLLGLYLALFIDSLDNTIVVTAVGTITADLNSSSGYAWIGSAFLLGAATSAPIWAKLSDIWGRRLILLGAISWFFLSSIVCALSRNIAMMIAGRALQGVGGGGLTQIINITISDLFSIRERAFYMATTEVVWTIASGIGPVLGGVLSQYASWRWIFWLNLPICGLAFVIILLFLDVHNPRTKFKDGIKAIDWAGSLSIIAMTMMTLLGLDFGGVTYPWDSAIVICLIVFGVLTAGLFIWSEKRLARYPLMPLAIFSNKHNLACFLTYFHMGFCFIPDLYFLPLFFQSVRGETQTMSGVLTLPCALAASVMGMFVGWAVSRYGRYREFIWAGLSIIALGNGLITLLDASSSIAKIIAITLLPGLGAGCLFSPAVVAIQANVAQEDTTAATSTLFFSELIATSISLVVSEVILQNFMQEQVPALKSAGLANGGTLELVSDGNAAAHVTFIRDIENFRQRTLLEIAFTSSLRNIWILYAALAAFSAVLSMLCLKHNVLSETHTEVKTGIDNDE